MAREKLSEQQWAEIRTLWISTSKSCREIASGFGVAESYIRKRAGKELWGPRNAPERKRAIVAAAMSGAQIGAQCAPRTDSDDLIQREAEEDIKDMNLAARVGRRILQRCEWLLDLVKVKDGNTTDEPALDDPKELKATAEAARSGLEMIRRARNLDEPAPPPPEASPLDALAHSLAQARKERA